MENYMELDHKYLRQLFVSCLEAEYTDSEGEGSYSYYRDGDLLYIFFEKSNGTID